MRKRKSFLYLPALIVLLSFVFPACDGKEVRSGNATVTAGVPEVTLRFYFGGDKKSATDEVWAKISEYVMSKGLNVKFDIHTIPFRDFKEKMLVMAASGDSWDMNFDAVWLSYKQMADKGSYMVLNGLLPKYAPNLYKKYEAQNTLSSATVNGEIVGLPWTLKMSERKFVGWRADLAEKAGIKIEPDSVKTIEDVDKLLRAFRKAYPNEKLSRTTPLSIYMIRDEWVDLNFHGLGFYLNDPKVTVMPVEQQPFYLESAKLSKVWYDNNLINRDTKIDKEGSDVQWRGGKLLFTITSHEWANADPGFVDKSFKQAMSLLYPDKKIVNRTALANVLAINRNSEHPDLVLRFLDMVETDRTLYDLLQYGINGKTYKLDGDMAVYPDGMDSTTSNYMEWGGQWAFWKPQFMRPTQTYGPGFWEREAEFASEPINVNSPVDSLFITEDRMKSELEKRDEASYEFSQPIEIGVVKGVDQAVSDYIELQKKNGLSKVLDETQRQVDAYLAEKK
jgi:putative aldouronate transport system substrate-binding protein